MHTTEIDRYKKHFKQYTNSFLGLDNYINTNIILKQDHTKRVCNNIIDICSSLKISDFEVNIAETIALYHDIGRFMQIQKYRTFNDVKSENHALLGIKVLKKENILEGSAYKDIIFTAVEFHNKKTIPEDINSDEIKYLKLIRDADKIDILNVLTNYYMSQKKDNPAIDLDLQEKSKYSQKVLDDFFSNRCIDRADLNSILDFKILQLSWIYDINFSHTLKIVKNKNYIEKIISILPESHQKHKIHSHIKNYFKQK